MFMFQGTLLIHYPQYLVMSQKKCSIGPGARHNPGDWHWYNIYGITWASKVQIIVTHLTYSDGTEEDIPTDKQIVMTFY